MTEWRAGLVTTTGLLVLAALVLLGRDISAILAGMVPLAQGASPYFVAGQAGFLYLWVPLVAIAASALFLAPGLLVALVTGPRAERFELWLLKGFVLSLFGVPILAALVQAGSGIEMTGVPFVLLLLTLGVIGVAAAVRRGVAPDLKGRAWDVAAMIAIPFAVVVLMSPKFYWENFNDDGAHAFLAARLFIERGLPFWPPGTSGVTGYPSTTMMSETFLQTTFVRFFGPHESALRLAYLPGVAVLGATIMAFARGPKEKTRGTVALGIGAQLLLFSFVMAFNPSYAAYFADIALPMTREPLIALGFLGGVLFFREGRLLWMGGVLTLGLLSAPNTLLLMLFFLGAYGLLTRPLPVLRVAAAGLLTIAIVVLATLAMKGLVAAHVTQGSGEFGPEGILRRLRFVTLDDPRRMLFWLLPAGVLPGFALLAWRWQDKVSKALTLTAVIYILFFYVQAYRVLPHHFAPAALLPLIVFWRLRPVRAAPLPAVLAALAGVALGAVASWPDTLRPSNHNRDLGQRVKIAVPIDPLRNPASLNIFDGLMDQAFPPAWTDEDLRTRQALEPLAINVYSEMRDADAPADYVVRPADLPLTGTEEIIGGPAEGAVLVVRDRAIHDRDFHAADQPVSIARVYRVTRNVIFGHGLGDGSRSIWDLAALIGLR